MILVHIGLGLIAFAWGLVIMLASAVCFCVIFGNVKSKGNN